MAVSIKFSDLDVCKRFEHPLKAKILKYIVALYSKESPLMHESDLLKRKIEACREAKLDSIDPKVIEMMDLKNPDVNNLIFLFHTFQSDERVTQLNRDIQLLWDIDQLLFSRTEIADEDELMEKLSKRADLSKKAAEITSRVQIYRSEIWPQEEVRNMSVTYVGQTLRPEQRIRMRGEIQQAS